MLWCRVARLILAVIWLKRSECCSNDNGVETAIARSKFAYGEQECLEMFMRAWHGDHYAQGWFTRHPKADYEVGLCAARASSIIHFNF
jgi:hypothetical protein